jgi:hypothetical protein
VDDLQFAACELVQRPPAHRIDGSVTTADRVPQCHHAAVDASGFEPRNDLT